MCKKLIMTAIICFVFPCFSHADQAAWVEKEKADKAAQMIKTGSEIRLFCAPCGDTVWTSRTVKKTEVKNQSGSFYQVCVNGEELDLAYTYILQDGKWQNLAMLLKLSVADVPEFLPEPGEGGSSAQEIAADEHPLDTELNACVDAEPSTANILNCIYSITEKWDAELNRVYQELRKRLNAEGRKALQESQRAWIRYRDLEFRQIDELYKNFDGSMYRPMRAEDRMEIIRNRVSELHSYLALFEMGD